MSDPRLTSAMLAGALMRLASRDGGFAAILAKGDASSGAILLQLLEKGRIFGLYERLLDPGGSYGWAPTGPQPIENTEIFSEYLERRRARDPDLWIVELDIPDAERFIAEILRNA